MISNAAVMLFGGIETTEGMIANAVLHLLSHPDQLALVQADAAPAAQRDRGVAAARARRGGRSTATRPPTSSSPARRSAAATSCASRSPAANRDPAVFPDPDRFDVRRDNARRHLAFAHGPHVCIGMHLARLEAHTAVERLLRRLPALRLDPATRPRRAGWCSASRPSCTCAGAGRLPAHEVMAVDLVIDIENTPGASRRSRPRSATPA